MGIHQLSIEGVAAINQASSVRLCVNFDVCLSQMGDFGCALLRGEYLFRARVFSVKFMQMYIQTRKNTIA